MTFFDRLQSETESERRQLRSEPIITNALSGHISLVQYVAFLTQAYHHVRHTVPLLRACRARMPRRLAWMGVALDHYIDEEDGHDEWILSDITACGADAKAVRRGEPAFATELMVAYAYHQIEHRNPVGFFGMVHVLEGTSNAIATSAAAAIRGALGLPVSAFRYLTSHGTLDIAHVRFFTDLMNRLVDPADQAEVIRCARSFYHLYAGIFHSLPARDEHAREVA